MCSTWACGLLAGCGGGGEGERLRNVRPAAASISCLLGLPGLLPRPCCWLASAGPSSGVCLLVRELGWWCRLELLLCLGALVVLEVRRRAGGAGAASVRGSLVTPVLRSVDARALQAA